MKSEAIAVVRINITVCWDPTPWNLVNGTDISEEPADSNFTNDKFNPQLQNVNDLVQWRSQDSLRVW